MELEGATARRNSLVFAVNGQRFELSGFVEPSTTLFEFLHTHTRFKSVKLGCGEGGCGACVVLLSKYDPLLDRVDDFTVSSCLMLLCSIDGCSITTSEGLGNSIDGFHPIHQRMAGFSATQCGFCTPGMCVSLFGALVNAEKTNRPEPPPGFSKLTASEAEKATLGNLCRCTGYRPIADVCKSFAADVDMEDLGFNSFWKKGETKEVKTSRLPLYSRNDNICTFPEFLKKEISSARLLDYKSNFWYTPGSMEELQYLLETNDTRIKLAVGNTGISYYKELEWYDKYIDLRYIPQLSIIRRDETGVKIGAAVTISKAIEALKQELEGEISPEGEMVFKKVADHLEQIASVFVRNMASVVGNLVLAQKYSFPSDIATVLLALDSMVNIITGSRHEKISLDEFLEQPPLDSKSVVLSVEIPYKAQIKNVSPKISTKLLFETYRAAPRPLGNALPHINAALLAELSTRDTSGGITICSCQLAFGAYGAKHAIRARKVENFLTGKFLTLGVLYEAIKLLGTIVVPENGTLDSAYRSSLAVGYLFEFFMPFTKTGAETSDGNSALKSNQFDEIRVPTLLSSAKQVFEYSKEYHPVGEPITKTGAALQASGEAVFVDDIPSPTNCLHGAFIYSTKPLARIKGIHFKPNSLPCGVNAVISFKDIPESGQNIGSKTIFGAEPLFANELTECPGQRVAFVVADTQKHADVAANLSVVDYDMEILELPIISVEDAVERKSFFEVPDFLYPKQVGDISKGMAEADQKIISAEIRLKSQYYFYMETQTALAVPDEDNCMVVYSSIQCPEYAHAVIARCLGVPEHNVRVIARRVGGGFGGKAIKSMPIATACALAAHKLQHPVRVYVNRKTDMIMAGGRHPMKITYSVGFKSSGKITALQLEILINAGLSPDISPMMPQNMLASIRKYDWGALSFDIKVCKTNQTSRSAMRGPGEVQGSFIAEAIIEHVASSLSLEVDSVRKINLHTYDSLTLFYKNDAGEPLEYTLPSIWDKLGTTSSYNQRLAMIKEFNSCNRWQKRGISRVPICHEVSLRPTPGKVSIFSDGSVAVEVGGIELGQGLWTKVKQMAAFALNSIQCDGAGDLLKKVRVVQADTLSLIQGGFTAGSTTSEASCEAVRICCNVLVERLSPIRDRLQKQLGSIKWETLISMAYLEAVNLQACTLYIPGLSSLEYLNYGAAVSEVELNLLTGETTILRTDIIYDCGKSLNPAVDLGQIEGAFVQGIGFFMLEEFLENSDGLVISDSTWTYKIPTMDTIPKQFNVEILNSGHHRKRVLSSKASGEPPLLLAASVHCATREAIREARKQLRSWSGEDGPDLHFQLEVPATMAVVKELCGLESVEKYLEWAMSRE